MANSVRKVLIVEDDLILNLLFRSYMEKLGYNVVGELISGQMAIDAAREWDPILILMDITLKGEMDGIQAIKEIQTFSDAPVIYITGNSDSYHRTRAKETGYLDYLVKPIVFDELKASVERHIDTIHRTL